MNHLSKPKRGKFGSNLENWFCSIVSLDYLVIILTSDADAAVVGEVSLSRKQHENFTIRS
jgi:hypothetical protein